MKKILFTAALALVAVGAGAQFVIGDNSFCRIYKDSSKKMLLHTAEFRYATSKSSVATVGKDGTIKAQGKGTCYIYVYAQNGYAKKVKVTVK